MEKRIMEGVSRYFATGVGLVTSTGRHGSNVMAVEWTMHISYEPMLIAIFIHEGSATYENIMDTKEFGVNISSDEQASLVNIAGGYSRKEIDKLNIGLFDTYDARCIKAPMLKGCVINAECLLVNHYKIGDHVAVIGEVVDAKFDRTKSPLIYHQGMYRKIGRKLQSKRRIVRVNKILFEELQKMSRNAFTMRCVVAMVNNRKGETLLIKQSNGWKKNWTLPWFVVVRGSDYVNSLSKHLSDMNLNVRIKGIEGIERLIFKHDSKELRANFVIYRCVANGTLTNNLNNVIDARWYGKIPTNTMFKHLILK
jgi:flavin reductase (DIM6/NTAB) family NADH-FMN oxidoreductase RutF